MDRPNQVLPPPGSLKIYVKGGYVTVDAEDKPQILKGVFGRDTKILEGFDVIPEARESRTLLVTQMLKDLVTPSGSRKSQTELNSHGDTSSLESGAKTSESQNTNTVKSDKSELGDDYVVVTPSNSPRNNSQSPTPTSLKDGVSPASR